MAEPKNGKNRPRPPPLALKFHFIKFLKNISFVYVIVKDSVTAEHNFLSYFYYYFVYYFLYLILAKLCSQRLIF